MAGKRIVRQYGREAIAAAGEAALTRSHEIASCDCACDSRLINIRLPVSALASRIPDLDALLVRTIPADTEGLALLIRHAEMMQHDEMLESLADARVANLMVSHVYDLVTLMLGGSHDVTASRIVAPRPAARMVAIKSDIIESINDPALSAKAVAARHGVSVRYVHKLFASEGQTFSQFVLTQRLSRVQRMLMDPGFADHPVSSIAYACGFGDLSHFNRAFRRQYGATPTEVRASGTVR
jgi:AraC-like DNA-binding protein